MITREKLHSVSDEASLYKSFYYQYEKESYHEDNHAKSRSLLPYPRLHSGRGRSDTENISLLPTEPLSVAVPIQRYWTQKAYFPSFARGYGSWYL
jgi:hypothetical protein